MTVQHSLKSGCTKAHFRQENVLVTTPYGKAWKATASVFSDNGSLNKMILYLPQFSNHRLYPFIWLNLLTIRNIYMYLWDRNHQLYPFIWLNLLTIRNIYMYLWDRNHQLYSFIWLNLLTIRNIYMYLWDRNHQLYSFIWLNLLTIRNIYMYLWDRNHQLYPFFWLNLLTIRCTCGIKKANNIELHNDELIWNLFILVNKCCIVWTENY